MLKDQALPDTAYGYLGASEDLASRFLKLDQVADQYIDRAESYALWTLPHVFPLDSTQKGSTQLAATQDSVGAQCVNTMANKLVTTLFPPDAPFVRLTASAAELGEVVAAAKAGDQDAITIQNAIDEMLSDKERQVVRELNYSTFRTEATTAAKLLLVTGNALMYIPDKKAGRRTPVRTYTLRDYRVVRDVSGTVIEIMLRDRKALGTFSQEVRDTLIAARSDKGRTNSSDSEITLYSQVFLGLDGKYHLRQAADSVPLDSEATWTADNLPWIPLTWNRLPGEDYGRGLVEDYAGAFNAIYNLTDALITAVGVYANLQVFIRPDSGIDIEAVNKAVPGTFHYGDPEGAAALHLINPQDVQMLYTGLDRYTRQVSQAFLLGSGLVRDAERVTAEEIRYNALELEMAHGGVYSRFAEEWQLRVATLMFNRLDTKIGTVNGVDILPEIITGVESLSRAGDLDNFRMWVTDLTALQAVPEEIRAKISPERLMGYCASRRGVPFEQILKTQQEVQMEQQQAQAQQQQLMAAQAGANAAEAQMAGAPQ